MNYRIVISLINMQKKLPRSTNYNILELHSGQITGAPLRHFF